MLLVDLHYGNYVAMTMEVKSHARRIEKFIHETVRLVHTELFLQEKDYWHKSTVHQEHCLGKMLHSAEYAGVKERQPQSAHYMQ